MALQKRHKFVDLLAIVSLALLLRLAAGGTSLIGSHMLLTGYDEYYHMRRIIYTVGHFPQTLWFDSYLNYPHGLNLTWPPLFDQLLAAISLIFGQHTQQGIMMVSSFMPVILGAITVAVVYFMIREVFDRNTALLASFMTAISSYHISKTMIGAVDHHGLEVLLLLGSLLFIVLAFSRSEKRYLFASTAGVMMAGLAYTWEGTDIYLGIFLVYAIVQSILDLKRGGSSKDMTIVLTVAFGVMLVLVLPFWNTSWLSFSFVGAAASIAAMLLLFAISHIMAEKRINWIAYPLVILVLISLLFPIFNIIGNSFNIGLSPGSVIEYLLGSAMSGKIAEAEPLFYNMTLSDLISSGIGPNLLFALAGLAALILYIKRNKDKGNQNQGQILILVWAIYSFILTIGQARFLYIFSIAAGTLISILFFRAKDYIENRMASRKQKPSNALAAILLILLVLPTGMETISFISGEQSLMPGDWYESLNWLGANSNSTSFYDNPSETPEYGIMDWWDYGNWIVYIAKRPVVANNFQAGAEDSARFYLSDSEKEATSMLDERRSRYVLVDYDMCYGKLPAIVLWANEDLSGYMTFTENGQDVTATPMPKFLNTTLARLYLADGIGMGHFRLIHESPKLVGTNLPSGYVKIFEYVPGALIEVKAGPDRETGALLNMTTNQGRSLTYVNEGFLKEGKYEIRVPYPTENRYGFHVLNPYLIFSGNQSGIEMMNINVSEQDILNGRIIEADFEANKK
jgi:oligosaccharyl transferase (archaeosortase A-associated)